MNVYYTFTVFLSIKVVDCCFYYYSVSHLLAQLTITFGKLLRCIGLLLFFFLLNFHCFRHKYSPSFYTAVFRSALNASSSASSIFLLAIASSTSVSVTPTT